MSFEIMQHDGMKVIMWFKNAETLVNHMLANPNDRYWRIK